MLLTELTLPFSPFSRSDAARKLISAGYVQLGDEGSYGTVLHKPGRSYVLKVFEEYDSAYLAFVALARFHPNPHFPKFYGNLVFVGGEFFAIRMEQLTPMPDEDETIDYVSQYVFGIGKDISKYPNLEKDHTQVLKWMDEHPSMKEACDLIGALLQHNQNFRADLKIDNIMLRGNTPVFVDPIALGIR